MVVVFRNISYLWWLMMISDETHSCSPSLHYLKWNRLRNAIRNDIYISSRKMYLLSFIECCWVEKILYFPDHFHNIGNLIQFCVDFALANILHEELLFWGVCLPMTLWKTICLEFEWYLIWFNNQFTLNQQYCHLKPNSYYVYFNLFWALQLAANMLESNQVI